LARLAAAGVEIVSRRDDGAVESYEQQIASVSATWAAIANYERRWPLLPVRDIDPEAFPDRLGPALENAREMSEDAYRAALIDQAHLRASHENIIRRADAMITLSAPGAAPIGTDQGSAVFNEASSVLGAPAINVPVLVDQEMPLGIQLLGSWHGDERLTAIARWIGEDLCAGTAA
jgi:Asp-tRNA(Asn)/Glu-tRNA(Gln) amidotransferase A subunit family amidase